MRPLVTAADIALLAKRDEKMLTVTRATIITPAARDAARDRGIIIVVADAAEDRAEASKHPGETIPGIDHDSLVRLVQNVIASMGIGLKDEQIIKHTDPSGLCIVSGKSLGLDEKGSASQELFSPQECAHMKAGFLCLDTKPFVRETTCEFIGYVIEGTVACSVNNREATARTGDVMYLPASARITLSSTAKAKAFFVTCPANSRNIHP